MAEKQGQTASADTKSAPFTTTRSLNLITDIVRLTTQPLITGASLSQEILDVLREMRDKQNALGTCSCIDTAVRLLTAVHRRVREISTSTYSASDERYRVVSASPFTPEHGATCC